jgi:hypothetical protein
MVKQIIKKYWPILFLVLLTIPSIWYLLLPGFFESDDGEWMVIRFSAFYQALIDGQFPVRFLGRLNYSYGYPVANFLYPGFMYFAVPIHVIGLDFVNTIKAVLIFSMLGTAIFSYFWLSKIFDRLSGVLGSLVVTYTPYHLFDLYKRGSVGELFAFVWIAFALWMIEARNVFFISIGIFLLAISHNTMFLFFVPFLFVYSLIRKTISPKETVISFALGILMSSFFIIPAIYELQFTNFAKTQISNISEYFVNLDLIGISSVFILLLSLFAAFKKAKIDNLFLLFLSASVLSIFLALNISEPIWHILPSNLIQFPFRLLSYLIFGLGFLTAFSVFNIKRQRLQVAVSVVALLILSAHEYIAPVKRVFHDDSFYWTNQATTTVKDEYMPRWVKENPTERYKNKVEFIDGSGEIKNLVYNNSKRVTFNVQADNDSKIRINTIFYPGWRAKLNGEEVAIDYSNDQGVMEIGVGAGSSNIELVFNETPVRTGANVLSAASFLGLIALRRRELIKLIKK